jgi:hypothetical protein
MRITVTTLRRLGLMGLLSLSFVTAAASPSAAAGPAVPSIDWQSCGSDHPNAECATVEVPLDYDQPSRATTPLALARVPATDPKHVGDDGVERGIEILDAPDRGVDELDRLGLSCRDERGLSEPVEGRQVVGAHA